jgi:hypothetical protein
MQGAVWNFPRTYDGSNAEGRGPNGTTSDPPYLHFFRQALERSKLVLVDSQVVERGSSVLHQSGGELAAMLVIAEMTCEEIIDTNNEAQRCLDGGGRKNSVNHGVRCWQATSCAWCHWI